MKSLAIAGALTLAVATAGCSPTGIPPQLPPEVQAVVTEAQAICGFLPTISSVVAIVGAAIPGVDTAETIATAICNAVSVIPKTGVAYGGARHVTVPLHGRKFVITGKFAG